MAIQLSDNLFVSTGYLDKNISVKNIAELVDKYNFDGQSVHMPEAFMGVNGVPYPLDFWLIPYNGDVKWEIKDVPSLEEDEDLSMFLAFINEFEDVANYYPIYEGCKVFVNGVEYSFSIDKYGKASFISTQEIFDETISDAITTAVDEIVSGASEAFDTLKEVEDILSWMPVENGEKHIVRHWRGTRDNYELLNKSNLLSPWTKYVVIDEINGQQFFTEYYGENQVSDLTGQLLPVKSIITDINEIQAKPYDRYLVGEDGEGYFIYEYIINSEGSHRWAIKQFDNRYGVRVIDKGLKNFVYVDDKLISYDDVDCGSF